LKEEDDEEEEGEGEGEGEEEAISFLRQTRHTDASLCSAGGEVGGGGGAGHT
jgi:hypothetical protein